MLIFMNFSMAVYFFLVEVQVAYSAEAKEKHHLIALKIRLEAHILVLSAAAAVAAEITAADKAASAAAETAAAAAAAAAKAAAALPASDIP